MFKNKGFTLVEVALVLIIGGILLASASALLLTYMKKTQINVTERRLDAIDDALQLFLNLNGRYPCAANLADLIDTATYGVEIVDCTTAPAVAGGRGGRLVRAGAVPVRTLNLPDDFIGDAWSGRFTYTVTEALAVAGTYNRDEGGIFVVDSNDNDVVVSPVPGSAHYVVVSHGQNNSGSTLLSGGGTAPCTAGNLENENCDNDAIFRSTLLLGTAANANLYDDIITVRANAAFGEHVLSGGVMAFNLNACPDGWVQFAAADARVIVGADGGTTYNIGDIGGASTVTLDNSDIGLSIFPTAVGLGALPAGATNIIEDLGALGAPHENMPPFVALLYCEKS